MKLFDKYLLREFGIPFITIVFGFVLLFVVFDFSSRLDDFIEHKMTPGEVLNFYFLYIPQMVVVVTPISLLLAIFYSLGRLCRNREILALRASGLSLMRIGRPLFIVGMVCAVTVFFINEHFVTQTYAGTQKFISKIKGKNVQPRTIEHRYFSYDGGTLYFDRYDVKRRQMHGLYWYYPGSKERQKIKILADSGQWIGGEWWLFNAKIIYHDNRPSPLHSRRRMYNWKFKPEDVAIEKEVKEMTFNELWHHLRHNRSLGMEERKKMKLQLNYKVAFPLLNLIVVLISLPLCLRTKASESMFIGLGVSLLLSFSYYGLFTFAVALGDKGIVAPWLAIWSPNLVFLVLGGILAGKMER